MIVYDLRTRRRHATRIYRRSSHGAVDDGGGYLAAFEYKNLGHNPIGSREWPQVPVNRHSRTKIEVVLQLERIQIAITVS